MFFFSILVTVPVLCDCLTTFNLTKAQFYNFVDKTFMMKVIMENAVEPLVLTAPSGFGKSWTLEIMQLFLSVKSDEGETKDIFRDTQILQNGEFVMANFRSHPVIYISFKPEDDITDFPSLVACFRKSLRKLFISQDYLLDSPSLTPSDLEEFKKWTNDNITDCGPNGLYILSRLLFTHHKKKVVLLIDDYDSNVINSIFSPDLDISEVAQFYSTVLSTAIVYNPHVKLSILTGTSCTLLNLFPDLKGALKCVKFLHETTFEPLFGLSESQVETLFRKESYKSLASRRADVRMWYNGFTNPALRAQKYNTRSVLAFLESGQIRIFWKVSAERPALQMLMYDVVSKSLFAEGESARVNLQQNASLAEFKHLKHMVTSGGWDTDLASLFLTMLMEFGYFTFDSVSDGKTASVRLPNLQICEALKAVVIETARQRQAGAAVAPK